MTHLLHTLDRLLSPGDFNTAYSFVGDRLAKPDVIIAPDGSPYLYRWHVVPRNARANVYFHIQIGDDPERPLHDHPWENQSVILAGGYIELRADMHSAQWGVQDRRTRHAGDVVNRAASDAHRLLLLPGAPYTMTMFSTGPTVRPWGFWCPIGTPPPGNAQYHRWYDHDVVTELLPDGRSIWKGPPQ